MYKSVVSVIFGTCLLLAATNARIVSISELHSSLTNHGVPGHDLNTWTCIVQHESNFETTALNSNTGDHGLFQISQIYWCSPPGTGCGVSCAAMRDDNINDDIACAQKIWAEHQRLTGNGFTAWVAYNKYCR